MAIVVTEMTESNIVERDVKTLYIFSVFNGSTVIYSLCVHKFINVCLQQYVQRKINGGKWKKKQKINVHIPH